MADQKKTVKFVLSPEQKAEIEKSTGKVVDSIELTAEELEQRIAPHAMFGNDEVAF